MFFGEGTCFSRITLHDVVALRHRAKHESKSKHKYESESKNESKQVKGRPEPPPVWRRTLTTRRKRTSKKEGTGRMSDRSPDLGHGPMTTSGRADALNLPRDPR